MRGIWYYPAWEDKRPLVGNQGLFRESSLSVAGRGQHYGEYGNYDGSGALMAALFSSKKAPVQ